MIIKNILFSFCIFIQGIVFANSSLDFLEKFPKKLYYKILHQKELVGRSSFSWKAEGPQLLFSQESEMKITLYKKSQAIRTTETATTNHQLNLLQFQFTMNLPEGQISISGKREKKSFILQVTQSGKTQTKVLPSSQEMLMDLLIQPYFLKQGFPKQDKKVFQVSMLEPSALVMVPMTLTIKKNILKKEKRWQGHIHYLSQDIFREINEAGVVLEETSDLAGLPLNTHSITEKEFLNLQLQGTEKDLVEIARVPFPEIPHPRQLNHFEVAIEGVNLKEFMLTRHRQRLKGKVLHITKEEISPSKSKKDSTKKFALFLKEEALIPVHDPLIQKKTKELIHPHNSLWERALKIHEFVYITLKKIPTLSVPNALEVLKTQQGDCNEHAALYTALARAAGIPTKTIVGLVYSQSFYGKPGFYYHAWVEVFDGNQWISLDPTWNQIPADATHLAFVEGNLDAQVNLIALMGRIKLKPVN